MIEIVTNSAEDTQALGKRLAECLSPGDVVAFIGDLAAGKTTMIQGMVAALGVDRHAESPTYTLVNEYEGNFPVYHMDCYRETHIEGWLEIGISEYFYGEGVCLVEWADRIQLLLPDTAVTITISHVFHRPEQRQITITAPAVIEKKLLRESAPC